MSVAYFFTFNTDNLMSLVVRARLNTYCCSATQCFPIFCSFILPTLFVENVSSNQSPSQYYIHVHVPWSYIHSITMRRMIYTIIISFNITCVCTCMYNTDPCHGRTTELADLTKTGPMFCTWHLRTEVHVHVVHVCTQALIRWYTQNDQKLIYVILSRMFTAMSCVQCIKVWFYFALIIVMILLQRKKCHEEAANSFNFTLKYSSQLESDNFTVSCHNPTSAAHDSRTMVQVLAQTSVHKV